MARASVVSFVGITLLLVWGCAGTRTPAPRTPADVSAGRRIYSKYCRTCHGSFSLRSTPPELGAQPELLYRTVRDGVPDTAMFGYGKMLTDVELTAVVDYLLTVLHAGESKR